MKDPRRLHRFTPVLVGFAAILALASSCASAFAPPPFNAAASQGLSSRPKVATRHSIAGIHSGRIPRDSSSFVVPASPPTARYQSTKSQASDVLLKTSSSKSPSKAELAAETTADYNVDNLQVQGSSAAALEQSERTKRVDNIFYINTAIVSFVLLSSIYQLTHVPLEALVALWEYDLGPHPADMTKLTIALDVLTRLPFDLVHGYEALVPTNPIFYKACTSGVAYGLGDFISQIYQGKTLSTLDLPRSARSGAAGFMVHGPLCHYWLTFMETYLDFGGAWWATGIKVTLDLTVWSIFLNAAYSTVIGTLAGREPKEVWGDVRATQWPALRSAWRFWPFVHTVSFSHAVPMDLKLLWVDVMEVIWVTILSKVANEDKNAKMAEAQLECEKDAVGDVCQTTLEFVEADEVVKKVPEVDPSLEIELTREVEIGHAPAEGELSFELPKRVLGACWPLIAMWPVLYAGYQAEVSLGLL